MTKIDSSFPTAQFHIDGFTVHRRDRDQNGGGLVLYVRKDVPSTLFENWFWDWSFLCIVNCKKKEMVILLLPNKSFITKRLAVIGRNRGLFAS